LHFLEKSAREGEIMEPGTKKFIRKTIEELDRHGWKPPQTIHHQESQEKHDIDFDIEEFLIQELEPKNKGIKNSQ
jgi:hypothetical protein